MLTDELIVVRFHGGFLDGQSVRSDDPPTGTITDFWNAETIFVATEGEIGAKMYGISPEGWKLFQRQGTHWIVPGDMDNAYRVTKVTHGDNVLTIDVVAVAAERTHATFFLSVASLDLDLSHGGLSPMTPELRLLRDDMDSVFAAAREAAAESPAYGTPEWHRLAALQDDAENASDAFVTAILAEIEHACSTPANGRTETTQSTRSSTYGSGNWLLF